MDMDLARHLIEQYGYLAVFVSTVIEGELVVVAAAALAAGGLLEAQWVILYAALGAFVGHLLLFALGRWKGMALIEAVPALRRHYPKANLIMDRYANYSVFIFQYMYGMRLVSAMLFGCSTISLVRFMLLEVINCIIWAMLAYFAGHLVGAVVTHLYHSLGPGGLLATAALVLLCLGLLYHRFGHRHVRAFLASGREPAPEQLQAPEGRHFLLEQIDYHAALARRNATPLSLILMRLGDDDRRRREDTLQELAAGLCRRLRLSDIPARFSHDTLAILAPGTNRAGAEKAISRLLKALPLDIQGLEVGISEYDGEMDGGGMLDAAFADLAPLGAAQPGAETDALPGAA